MNSLEFTTGLLGIQGWQVRKMELNEYSGRFTLELEKIPGESCVCAKCGGKVLAVYDHYPERQVEELPAFGHRVFLRFSQARVECPYCHHVESERLEWVEPYQNQTVRYQRYLATLCDYMPVADVAELTYLSKDALYRIDKKYLAERKERYKKEEAVFHLGIDEIALRKGHKYATVFYDLDRGMVIGLVKERKQRNVSGFFRRWGKEKCAGVEAVCCDLWAAFHNSVRIHLKNALLVFDKFHVFKYLSDAVDKVRRDEQNRLGEKSQLIKGSRWIILKKDLTRKQQKQLKEVMEQNKNIAKAVLLRESFSAFYEAETAEEAESVLMEWLKQCKESRLLPFSKLARRLLRWKEGILAYFVHRITNGISEGINNKIKVIKRRSYGFKDMEYFFLKILMSTGFIPKMREAYP